MDTWTVSTGGDVEVELTTYRSSGVGEATALSACYAVRVRGVPWFVGSQTELYESGRWHNSSTGELVLNGTDRDFGTDVLGSFASITLHWKTRSGGVPFDTSIRVYNSSSSIVFAQVFPRGASGFLGTASPTHTQKQWGTPGSAWPSLDATGTYGRLGGADGLGFAAWRETAGHPVCGRFPTGFSDAKASSPDGVPLMFFDEGGRTAVLSPLTSMLSTVYDVSPEGVLRCGVQGTALMLPAGHSTESVLFVGRESDGVNEAMMAWGDLLRQRYGKPKPSYTLHTQLERLGYSSVGHYFYGIERNETAEDTMLAVAEYAEQAGLPYAYFLIDSWWYKEGPTPDGHGGEDQGFGGTWRWDDTIARAPHMFPHGLRALSDKLGVPLVQHMGKWTGTAADSSRHSSWKQPPPYALSGPGKWIVEPDGSLPTGTEFWDSLWRNASEWGLQTFKLDHVQATIPDMNYTSRDVNAVESWLTLMTNSAYRHGIYKQYGGHYSGGVLHSVTLMGATVARVSDDYIPPMYRPKGSCEHLPPAAQQPLVTARGNVLLSANTLYPWAIGLLPYRDAFMSGTQKWETCTCLQGNAGPESAETVLKPEWWGLQEGLPELQALVAALSAGPIAPGDGIGDTDVDLVMRTCRADGILLKPERPIFPINSWWTGNALGSGDGPTPRGAALNTHSGAAEVGYTFTELNGQRYYFVLGVGLGEAFQVTPSDVRSSAPAHWQWGWDCMAKGCPRSRANDTGSVKLVPFGEGHPIVLPPYESPHGLGWGRFRFVRTAPELCNGWILLGETDKFISVSRSRIIDMAVDCNGGLVLQVGGGLGEVVTMAFRPPRHSGSATPAVVTHSCTVGVKARCSIAVAAATKLRPGGQVEAGAASLASAVTAVDSDSPGKPNSCVSALAQTCGVGAGSVTGCLACAAKHTSPLEASGCTNHSITVACSVVQTTVNITGLACDGPQQLWVLHPDIDAEGGGGTLGQKDHDVVV